jgi:hypothetical protein
LGDGAIRREEALGMPRGFEALHPPFPLARRLVGVFGDIVKEIFPSRAGTRRLVDDPKVPS